MNSFVASLGRSLRQGLRSFGRDWRSGELRLLILSLIVAVAATTSVGFFIDRLRGSLTRDAAQLLGADLVVISDLPIAPTLFADARKAGLASAETVIFPSMALATTPAVVDGTAAGEPATQLVAVKAVSAGYPLRGALRTASSSGVPDEVATDLPAPGTVWVDAALLPALHVAVGDTLTLGDSRFRIARLVTLEPDRGVSFVNLSPRVLMRLDDLAATHLLQAGSRETHRLLVAGSPDQVKTFRASVAPALVRGQRIESLDAGRPDIRATLDRAERFLTLVAFLTAMLAALAVALASRRFTQRHLDATAVMRCLGVSQRSLLVMHLSEFGLVGLVGSLLGVALGYVTHFVFVLLLGSMIATGLPQPSAWPAVQGLLLGLVMLAGFAFPPVVQLRHVAPVRVFRRDVGLPRGGTLVGYGIGIAAFAALTLWSAGDPKVGAITLGGFVAATVIFAITAWLLLRALSAARYGVRLDASWRYALASMQRRPLDTVVQTVAIAIGLMALLLLSVTRTDLVAAWQKTVPPDAPNRFAINLQPDQRADFAGMLRAADVTGFDLAPMVRGRLVAVDGKPVVPKQYVGDQAQRLVDREFNLSYTSELPAHNSVAQGAWFAPGARDEISIEEGIAKTLGIKLGDTMRFDIAGVPAEGRVTSLRKLDWDSMRVNFFVIFPPAALDKMAQSWISAFHVEDTDAALTNRLVQRFPNLTVIDTGAIFRQIQAIVDQVVQAVEFLFLFTLAAGVLVLYAALLSSRDERTREAALLRALGASRKQLTRAQLAEFGGIGLLAGLLAAAGATATGWVLATKAFDFPYSFGPMAWIFGIAGGVVLAVAGGWFGLRTVMNEPPLRTLREA
jgi:putative ABC transport system permease protein